MRIAHVLPLVSSRFGGPAVFTVDAAESLGAAGHDVTVFSTNMGKVPSSGDWRAVEPEELPPNADRLKLELFEVRAPHRLVYSPALAARLDEAIAGFDIVHIHSLWVHPQYAAQRAARKAGVPYVVSPHGALDPFLRRRGRGRKALTSWTWQNSMLEHAAALHITTSDEGDLIADIADGVPRRLVANGIWVDRLAGTDADGARFRARELGGFDGPLVLYFGRLTFKKGVDILIRSFSQIADRVPDARLAIVGPDDEGLTGELQQLAESLGIGDRVVFTGPRYGADRGDALAAADVWALSSHSENFGIAVIEAMAAGCATVISPEVNLAGEIEQAGAGSVAPLDPARFGDAIAELLEDDSRRVQVQQRAREFAARYDWSVIGPQLAAMYEELAGGNARDW